MSTTTVRVSSETHRVLTLLAQQQQESITALLEAAVELYRRQLCLQATNAAYAALRSDPVAWAALQQEQASWEHTVGDGVVDEGTMTNGASTLTRRGLDGQP